MIYTVENIKFNLYKAGRYYIDYIGVKYATLCNTITLPNTPSIKNRMPIFYQGMSKTYALFSKINIY